MLSTFQIIIFEKRQLEKYFIIFQEIWVKKVKRHWWQWTIPVLKLDGRWTASENGQLFIKNGVKSSILKSRYPLSPGMWQYFVTVCHIFCDMNDKVFVSKLNFLLSRLKLMYWNDGIESYHEYDILTAVNREFSQIIITNQQNESSRRHHFQFCNITGFI